MVGAWQHMQGVERSDLQQQTQSSKLRLQWGNGLYLKASPWLRCTSSSNAHLPKPLQTGPSTRDQVSKYLNLWSRAFLIQTTVGGKLGREIALYT